MIKKVCTLANLPLKNRIRTLKLQYNYITPIEKPVLSVALNSISQLSAQCMTYGYDQFSMAAPLAVIAGGFAFKIGLDFLGLFFQSLNLRKKDTWAHRWIDKIFLVDLRRDVVFYELQQKDYRKMLKYYSPQRLFTSLLKTYTLLNFFRGCHYLLSNPTFSQFCSHQMLPLMSHDPLFLLPLPIILLNYLILSKSRHPFLIHMVRKQNKMMCFTLAFMSGLLFAPLPSIYPLAYIGVGLGHLTVRGCKNRMEEWGQIKQLLSWKKK